MKKEKVLDFLVNAAQKEYEKSLTLDRLSLSLMQVLALLGAAQFYLFTSYEFNDPYGWRFWSFLIPTALSLLCLVISGVFLAKSYAPKAKYSHIDYSRIEPLLKDYEKKDAEKEDAENTMRDIFHSCVMDNQPIITKKLEDLHSAKKFMMRSALFLLIEAIFFVIAAKI